MKTKILCIILSIILIISTVFCAFAYAKSTPVTEDNFPDVKPGEDFVKEDVIVPTDISYMGKKLTLEYQSSHKKIIGVVYDKYSDENGYYDVYDGKYIISFESRKKDETKTEVLDENQLIEIASDTLEAALGSRYDGLEYTYTTKLMDTYYINFAREYNGFISGNTASLKIKSTGDVSWWSTSTTHFGFNPETLKGITEEKIEEYVDQEILSLGKDAVQSYEIKEVAVTKLNGQFVLKINTSVVDVGGDIFVKEIYYEI